MPPAETPVWTVAALLQWTERHFAEKKLESPRLDAQVLLAHALGLKRSDLYVRHEYQPTESERALFRSLVTKRLAKTPVAYLVGHKEFFLLPFEVNSDVLIPRPSTETLVMTGLKILETLPEPKIIDLGTGSGCIAISIAVRNSRVRGLAADISEAALSMAHRNAVKHGVSNRIELIHSDLFNSVPRGTRYDMVVSNPPYIPSGDIGGLASDVKDHEPRSALDGGEDGYAVVDRILEGAAGYLIPEGWLLLEVGIEQADRVVEKAKASGWQHIKTINDVEGVPRVVQLKSSVT